ncbi:Phenylacetate-coenzyme A ligase [Thalassoglobus neptunius]|uniref:Phenylacetate-coenzyme A ligase n=1 Tax=Thalassoglobus neptunius TaxID=1938619 RepID=A0A5C5WNV8_9PLAN|nr:AMP-binding protein [Thalassoglobus neptunius]TWT51502.1 Phenylacetate-coenzyme A ligase [Thalassoglobus neptunius]
MVDPFPELWSRSQIENNQSERLRALVEMVAATNPFWKERWKRLGFDPASVKGIEDLSRMPMLTKQELVDDQNQNLPYGRNLTFPVSQYSRLHQTSGTTGKPMRWLDTPASWDWLMGCWAQIYRLIGITSDDVFAFPFSFGPFIGFWAAFEGAQRLGNLSLTMGGMTSEARLNMILELDATIICCTPTYALRLTEVAESQQLPISESSVRMIVVAGEPGGAIPAIRNRISSAWNARVIDHWGMTDIGSLGIEPIDRPGQLLLLESECIAEILNPETFEPVEPGELGELIITNLGRTGQPVIRYRTGDLVKQCPEVPEGGCQFLSLDGGILGRADDMVTIRGNNVFPSSLDAILREIPGVAEYMIRVVTRRSMPHMRVEVEPVVEQADEVSVQQLTTVVQQRIKDRLNFQAEVVSVGVNELPRFELKGRRFHRET